MKLHGDIKRELRHHFMVYYQEYIVKDYKTVAFNHLKAYYLNRKDKQNYWSLARSMISVVRLR